MNLLQQEANVCDTHSHECCQICDPPRCSICGKVIGTIPEKMVGKCGQHMEEEDKNGNE